MKNIYKALANFQQEVPTIHKGTAGYGYSYADLTAIYKIINPLMKKHGLGFTQPIVNNQMKTIVFHVESGESIESVTDIPMNVQLKGQNDYQVMGSAFTYFRRYTLSSMLGLVTDKDIDASGEQTGKRKETITDERLHAALEKIKKGEYTMDKLKENKYALNGLFLIDETESDPDSKAPTPKRKETITDERLQAALEKIKKGEYTMEKLKDKFELTVKQLELC